MIFSPAQLSIQKRSSAGRLRRSWLHQPAAWFISSWFIDVGLVLLRATQRTLRAVYPLPMYISFMYTIKSMYILDVINDINYVVCKLLSIGNTSCCLGHPRYAWTDCIGGNLDAPTGMCVCVKIKCHPTVWSIISGIPGFALIYCTWLPVHLSKRVETPAG